MMKRVFICSGRALFGSGIRQLLDAQADIDVIGWESDVELACQRIQEMQPDVVLVVAEGSSGCRMSDRQRFLRAEGKTRIIELDLEDRKVYVYTGEQLTIKEVDDLVRAIEEPVDGTPAPSASPGPPHGQRRKTNIEVT
ncbi:MAG: hypothetical protein IT320_16610 [Anaerolineae bacterium]|nr:hypothetical protein [Anaerolineae bacterium]